MSSYLEKNGHLVISTLKYFSFFKVEKGYRQLKYLDLGNVRVFLNKNLQKIIKHRKLKISLINERL